MNNDKNRTDLDSVKSPFGQLTESEQEDLHYWIVEGNNHDDLATMYLESLNADQLKALVNEVRSAFWVEGEPHED